MEVKETRRRNLKWLIDTEFCGKQKNFADAIDRQPDYISRCLSGKKNIGEQLARHIENKVGRSKNWLDESHDEELVTRKLNRDANALLDLYESMNEEGQKTLREVGAALAAAKRKDLDPAGNEEP